MFNKLLKRIRKKYFEDKERLSWAPFPSFGLVGESGNQELSRVGEIMTRMCRYYGGETISIEDAIIEGYTFCVDKDIEKIGYFYGKLSIDDEVTNVLVDGGRLVILLSESSSQALIEFAHQQLNKENVFVMSVNSLEQFTYRLLSDLLYFITNHEGPVIIKDFIREYYTDKESSCTDDIEISVKEMELEPFKKALRTGEVLNQDDKFYRVN